MVGLNIISIIVISENMEKLVQLYLVIIQ